LDILQSKVDYRSLFISKDFLLTEVSVHICPMKDTIMVLLMIILLLWWNGTIDSKEEPISGKRIVG
jgi:hypothetical protein